MKQTSVKYTEEFSIRQCVQPAVAVALANNTVPLEIEQDKLFSVWTLYSAKYDSLYQP